MEIPDDVIVEILSNLPLKSAVRFQLMSKRYAFPKKFSIDESVANYRKLGFLSQFYEPNMFGPTELFVCDLDETEEWKDDDTPSRLVLPFVSQRRILFCGTCRGIILLLSQEEVEEAEQVRVNPLKLVLWNPTTRQVKTVPDRLGRYKPYSVGLGYNEDKDDMRVIEICGSEDNGIQFCIFSVNSNTWMKRSIRGDEPILLSLSDFFTQGCVFGLFQEPNEEQNEGQNEGALNISIGRVLLNSNMIFEVLRPDVRFVLSGSEGILFLGESSPLGWEFSTLRMESVDPAEAIGKDSWRRSFEFTFNNEGEEGCPYPLAFSKSGESVLIAMRDDFAQLDNSQLTETLTKLLENPLTTAALLRPRIFWFNQATNERISLDRNLPDDLEVPLEWSQVFVYRQTIQSLDSKNTNKDVSQGLDSIAENDRWIASTPTGQAPVGRYEHAAAVIQDQMYIFGGCNNGDYLSDLHVLDLKSWTWSKVDAKAASLSLESPTPGVVAPCAGHSLIPFENKLLLVSGYTKDPSETIQVKVFHLQTGTWSDLETYGKPPVSRGGQSVTLVGKSLVIFGGKDINGTTLNDLYKLDLETMTWGALDASGLRPSPRINHAAAVHEERYLHIFGGLSSSTRLNDVHVFDLQEMKWSSPAQHGGLPDPRCGHASVTIGEKWFIVGGDAGYDTRDISETFVLNMSSLEWSVVTSVEGRVPPTSEGLSVVVASSSNGEDVLVSFGGYNGICINAVNVLKPTPSHARTDSTVEEGGAI